MVSRARARISNIPRKSSFRAGRFGETQHGTFSAGGGGGAGKVQMEDFSFVMSTNKASPLLFQKCANGEHIKSAILTVRKAGKEQQEYLKWTFTDLLVSSYKTSGSAGSDLLPMDEISLNFAKVQIDYKEQNADGTLDGRCDQVLRLEAVPGWLGGSFLFLSHTVKSQWAPRSYFKPENSTKRWRRWARRFGTTPPTSGAALSCLSSVFSGRV